MFSTFLILLSPFAPHVSEELWEGLGNKESISKQKWPQHNEKFLVEQKHEYPISFNGKMRFKANFSLSLSRDELQSQVETLDQTKKWLDGKTPKKIIVVPGNIVNIVV